MEKLLHESRDGPELCVSNDFILTLLSKGQERTESEYRTLFAKHGFVNLQVKVMGGMNHYDVMSMTKPLWNVQETHNYKINIVILKIFCFWTVKG